MKLYKTTAAGNDRAIWAGSQAQAGSDRKAFVSSGAKRADVKTEEIEVPSGKAGLIQFLNDLES